MSNVRLLLLTILLGGCAGSPQPVTGDASGGVINWFGINTPMAQQRADTHCREYGKAANITSIDANAGGQVAFQCK